MPINSRKILNNRLDTSHKPIVPFKVSFIVKDNTTLFDQIDPLIILAKTEHAAWNMALIKIGDLYPAIDLGNIEVQVSRSLDKSYEE
ncbi:MAG TPA: hypothetical protein VK974_05770 [Methylophilaceae bacterium]|nr:hypothetical protein [Methylophilaceae bacterium]